MNDASDQSVKKEATPLVVGGEVSKPKRPINKKLWTKVAAIVVTVLIIVAGAVAGWWFFIREDPNYLNISQLNSQDRYIERAQKLAGESVPKEPRDKAIHYGNIAAALKSGKEYVYAERYYLLAQKTVDENNVDKKDVEFYRGLSELYEAMGNQKKADQYSKKEEDFLKANYSPEVLEQMNQVKLNDPPR